MLSSFLLMCTVAQFNAPEAKAVITDQFGQPLTLERSAYGLLVVSARKSVHDVDNPNSVKWTILPAEYDARKWVPNIDGMEFGIALEGEPVDITIILSVAGKDGSVDHLIMTVKCGKGPQPPPPGPGPGPKPKVDKLKLTVVEDSLNRKPATSMTLQDRALWDGLKSSGHSFLVVPENSKTAGEQVLVTQVLNAMRLERVPMGGAYLLVQNADTGEQLFCGDLPTSDALKKLLSQLTGK